jgi:hypothetical protein
MYRNFSARRSAAAMAVAGVALTAAAAPQLAMLGTLDDGIWEVRLRDGGEPRRLCVNSGLELIQLRHPGAACSRFVVEDGPSAVTVQYTCRGHGYGRTSLRRETSTLVQVSSQGIANDLPFDFKGEARRVASSCH